MEEWEEKMETARRLHRPDLDDWECDGMHETFPAFVEQVQQFPNFQSFFAEAKDAHRQKRHYPAVLDAATLTREEFYQYEIEQVPCVIKNIPAGYDGGKFTKPWPALEKWKFDTLKDDDMLLNRKFKCGEDDDERNIKVRLSHFLSYTEGNKDDSPLYIFDSSFEDDDYAERILDDYRVPSYFKDDLFNLVSESRRPPYRWFLVGPERSGTCLHIDPLSTSAWNTVIAGEKRWVLFPPHVPKKIAKGKDLVRDDEDDEAIHYFMYILPRIKRKARALRGQPEYKDFCCYEFTQYPGETVFVPYGWWHAVLNLTDTVAVTQNFCSRRNFDQVWKKTRTGRKKMAWKWLCKLEEVHPDLANRAKAANARDNFVMRYDPAEVARRAREEEKKESQQEQNESFQAPSGRKQSTSRARGTPGYASDRERSFKKKSKSQKRRKRFDSRPTVSP